MTLPPVVAPLVSVVETPHDVVKVEGLSLIVRFVILAEFVAVHASFAFAEVVATCVDVVGVAAHIAPTREGGMCKT